MSAMTSPINCGMQSPLQKKESLASFGEPKNLDGVKVVN